MPGPAEALRRARPRLGRRGRPDDEPLLGGPLREIARGLAQLVDRSWPTVPRLLLVGAAVVVVGSLILSPGKSTTDKVTDAVHDFGSAVTESRGDDACRLLTPDARRFVTRRVPELSCARYVETYGAGFDAKALSDAKIRRIVVYKTLATIATPNLVGPSGRPVGVGLGLIRSSGTWRIAVLKLPR